MSNEINHYKFWLAEASKIIDDMLPYVDDDLTLREIANDFKNLEIVQDAVRSQSNYIHEQNEKYKQYRIKFLTGVKELKPVDYTLRKLPDGMAELSCEYSSLVGEYCDIVQSCLTAGIKYRVVE